MIIQNHALKLFGTEQIREWDKYTIEKEGSASIDLMERAAAACTDAILNLYPGQNEFIVVAGTGNNGGDGIAIARMLAAKNKKVKVFIIRGNSTASVDFIINEERLKDIKNNLEIIDIHTHELFPKFKETDCVIDAIFGTGLNKEAIGIAGECIRSINQSDATVIAIDLPSGMFADISTNQTSAVIEADHTLSFQIPKTAFMYPESENYTGIWQLLDIGLSNVYYQTCRTDKFLLDRSFIASLCVPRKKFAHKGQFGHALLIAGSYGKIGAAVMSGSAAVRSGLGLLTVHTPRCGVSILQSSVPEAMVQADEHEFLFSAPGEVSHFDVIGIGPGIGCGEETDYGMEELLKMSANKPMVFDADAINLLAADPELLSLLPPNSILTPHIGEFDRLCGQSSDSFERHVKQIEFSKTYGVYVVLKGAHTCISTPDGLSFYNNSGNPGMAKGGSGDVLTGLMCGLLAQMPARQLEAALIAVYLHGYAGDLAAAKFGQTGMKAGDIIDCIPEAFSLLTE